MVVALTFFWFDTKNFSSGLVTFYVHFRYPLFSGNYRSIVLGLLSLPYVIIIYFRDKALIMPVPASWVCCVHLAFDSPGTLLLLNSFISYTAKLFGNVTIWLPILMVFPFVCKHNYFSFVENILSSFLRSQFLLPFLNHVLPLNAKISCLHLGYVYNNFFLMSRHHFHNKACLLYTSRCV